MSDIRQKAKDELNKLNFPGDDDCEVAEDMGQDLSRDFRNSYFFSSRPGEEDDDFPHFTGKKEVLEHANRFFSQAVLDAYKVSADDQEKEWFTIYLRKK